MRKILILILGLLASNLYSQELLKEGGFKTSGATSGQVLKWNGTTWTPANDGGNAPDSTFAKGTVSAPSYSGKTISTNVFRLGKTSFVTDDTTASLNIKPRYLRTWAEKKIAPSRSIFWGNPAYVDGSAFDVQIIDINPMKADHFPSWNFGRWRDQIFTDSLTNLANGRAGNSIRNVGFNMDNDNTAMPRWYFSTEQHYTFPGNPREYWEHHLEVFDTLGRSNRPFNLNGSYNGNEYGAGFRVSDFYVGDPRASDYRLRILNGVTTVYNSLGVGGVTTPYTKLDVNGDMNIWGGSGASLYLSDVNFQNPSFYNKAPGLKAIYNATQSVAADLGIYAYNGNRNLVAIASSNGNFGIGNSDPTEKLHVTGSIRVTGAIKDSNNESGTSGQVLSSTTTGTDWIDAPAGTTNLTITGSSSPLTLNSSNGSDVTVTAGTNISLAGTSGNITINNTQTEVNGIYTGSGTVPANTTATLSGTLNFTNGDAHTINIGDVGNVSGGDGLRVNTTSAGIGNLFDAGSIYVLSGAGVAGNYVRTPASNLQQGTVNTIWDIITGVFRFSDGRGTKTGIEYAGDYSSAVLGNARSIPDVGTVKSIYTAGTGISLTPSGNNIVVANTQTEVNGIYTGSGTIPNNTNATATDDFTITTTDNTGTQSPKFRVVASGTDPGVQVWKVGNDSLQLSFISGEPTLEAIGTSGNDFWINAAGNDLRLGNNSTGVFTHTTKNVLGGYLAVPYVSTAADLTVSESTVEVDVVGTSGIITLTFNNTSNLNGSAAKTITVRNRGAYNVTLSRGSQSWEWSDMTGANTASNQTLAAGETARMLWIDDGVTDYYVLHKMPSTFTGGSTDLAVSGTSSPLTLTSSNGTDVTFTAGTNVTLSGSSSNITINATTQPAYATVQEEGSGLTQRSIINFVGSTATAADNTTKTDVTFDSDVNALASTATTGLYAVTGTGTSATRTITAPAAGITVSNGNGVSGNPTLALANDLAALEGLGNGIPARTGTDTWSARTITAGTGITVTNGDGVSGNPTISLSGGASGDIVNGGNTTGAAVTIGTNDNNALNLETNNVTRLSIASGTSTGGQTTLTTVTANTSTTNDALTLSSNSTGSAATGFGTGILFKGETSGVDNVDMGRLRMVYDGTGGSEQTGLAIDLNSLGTVAQAAKFDRYGTLSTGRSTPTQYGGANVGIIPASDLLINTTTANNTYIGGGTGKVKIRSSGSGTYGIEMGVTDATTGSIVMGLDDGSTLTSTSTVTTDRPTLELKHGFAAASGGNRPISLLISNTLNQTGEAFGVMTGIKINPTLTNIVNTYRAIDIASNHTSSKGIYQSGSSTTNNFVGKTYFGSTSAPTALLQVAAGSTTVAPVILTSGTNLTTPVAGAIEWDGTNLFATQTSGPTRKTIAYTTDIGAETIISPSSFSTDQNNWNPASLSTATTIRLTTSVNLLMITGITAPTVAKTMTLTNIGSNTVLLTAQDVSSSSGNRFLFFRDIPIYPGRSVQIYYDLTSAGWRLVDGQEGQQLSEREFYSEYSVFGTTTPVGTTVSTTDGTITAPTETLPASGNLAPGGSSAANAYFYTSGNSLYPFFISSTVRTSLYFEGTIVTPANLSDGSNSYAVACGFASTIGTSEPLGANLFYNHSLGTTWHGYTKGAGNSLVDSGITFSASTKYKLGIQVRPDFTVAYFINDTYVGETTTNIPTSRAVAAGIQIYKLGGSSRTLQYVEMEAFQIR